MAVTFSASLREFLVTLHRLEKFLDVVHPAVPIFSRARFFPGLRDSLCGRDLISTLLIITAKLTGFTFSSCGFDLDSHVDLMLSSGSLQEDVCDDPPSLNQLRKACLLAFYEFHQFPGRQAWMRIGKLVRLAYWIGLDRIDRSNTHHTHEFELVFMNRDDVQDWRLIWWLIYRLDSYVNLATGTPYLIDERLVKTALIWDGQLDCQPLRQLDCHTTKLFLPSRPENLWELVPAIASRSSQTSLFNLHIVTTTVTRQVGRELQSLMMGPPFHLTESFAGLERHLFALRLSPPNNYLNPLRNAFSNETRSEHHARLITILHLHIARLLASIINCACLQEGHDWLLSWQQVLETCQDVASISEQWNSTFSLSVDPAVCIIIFTALLFVHLQKNFISNTNSALQSNLEHCEKVFLLLLEQFANTWTLPRLLLRESLLIQMWL